MVVGGRWVVGGGRQAVGARRWAPGGGRQAVRWRARIVNPTKLCSKDNLRLCCSAFRACSKGGSGGLAVRLAGDVKPTALNTYLVAALNAVELVGVLVEPRGGVEVGVLHI